MDPMRKLLTTVGLILLWTAIVAAIVVAEAIWFAAPNVQRGDVASLERHFVRTLREAASEGRVGSAALVLIERGKVVAEHSFGAPVELDATRFRVASVSKAVTAWGVMRLVQDGRIDLDAPALRYLTRWRFPGSERYRDRVTVRHLLSHTAGLDDGLGYAGFPPGVPLQTLEESLTSTKDVSFGSPRAVVVTREPGTALAYSGGGYTVLQLVIEEVTRRRFEDFMAEAVLQPLGMTHSAFDCDERDLAPNFDRDLAVLPHRRYTANASVGLCTTPRDLARFVLAFTSPNAVLSRETLSRMSTAQRGTSGSWGLGLTRFAPNVVGHSGGTGPAWGAMFHVSPATGNGMVVMSTGGRGGINRLGGDWVYWETGTIPFEARRQIVYDRLRPASIAVVAGAVAIVIVLYGASRRRAGGAND